VLMAFFYTYIIYSGYNQQKKQSYGN